MHEILIESLALQLCFAERSGLGDVVVRGIRSADVFAEIEQASELGVVNSSAEVGNE